MSQISHSSNDSESKDYLSDEVKKNFKDNVFGQIDCKLRNKVEIGQPIIAHTRCNQDCYKLIIYETLCLGDTRRINQNKIKILSLEEAVNYNEQILEITLSKKTKKLNKYNNIHNINQIIKQNAYLIRKLAQDGFTKAYISTMTGLFESSIYYREKQIPNSNQLQTQFYFGQDHIEWLKSYVNSSEIQDLWNQQLILHAFKNHFKLNEIAFGMKQFRGCLIAAGLVYKQVHKRSPRYFLQSRNIKLQEYCVQLLSYIKQNYNTIYIDETTFSHQTHNPKFWQAKESIKFRRLTNIKQHLNIIGGIGSNGFQFFQIILGNVNQFVFGQFLQQLIVQAQSYYSNEKFVIVLDNCPIHQSKLIKQRFMNNIYSLFLAPYSPELNPIEKVWKLLKNHIYKKQPCSEYSLIREIHVYLKQRIGGLIESLMRNMQKEIKIVFKNIRKDQ